MRKEYMTEACVKRYMTQRTLVFISLFLTATLAIASGCTLFHPTKNPDGTPKVNPITLTQRTTQYTDIYVSTEKSVNDLYEQGFIPPGTFRNMVAPAVLSARQALKDMRAAAKEQNATSWGVYEKGFLGALDGIIAQRRTAEALKQSTTRPAFSPP